MSIGAVQSGSYLRLVQSAGPGAPRSEPVQPATPVRPAASVQADAFSFERTYRANLPRPALTEAHQRLERIRELVAAEVAQPMHFEEAVTVRSASGNNPYAVSYPRIVASPGEQNTRATEATA